MFVSISTQCSVCGDTDPDGLFFRKNEVKPFVETLSCPHCKTVGSLVEVPTIGFADTKHSWGDAHWDRWDHGLGCRTYSKAHRAAVMKSLGVREGWAHAG